MKQLLLKPMMTAVLFCFLCTGVSAQESFIGEIKLVGFNFAPRNFADCDGRMLPISQYPALFSLLGTVYGGDGRTTFALPDLRGRIPLGVGNGPGLADVKQGEKSINARVTKASSLDTATLPGTATLGLRYVICLQGIFPSRS